MPNILNSNNEIDNLVIDSNFINDIITTRYNENMKKQKENILKDKNKELNFDQISIKVLYYNLINNIQQIINDIIRLFSNPVPKHQDLIQLLKYYVENIFKILTYGERIFYIGIVLIIISFLAYFILVTS